MIAGTIVTHRKTKKRYIVLRFIKLKQDTGNWTEGVIYSDYSEFLDDQLNSDEYCRSLLSLNNSFDVVKGEDKNGKTMEKI